MKDWFRQTIVANHVGNTRKLADPGEFNINPFLAPYLAAFLAGGLSSDHRRWIRPKYSGFFLPVKVLSRVFRGKFVEALRRAAKSPPIASARTSSTVC